MLNKNLNADSHLSRLKVLCIKKTDNLLLILVKRSLSGEIKLFTTDISETQMKHIGLWRLKLSILQ